MKRGTGSQSPHRRLYGSGRIIALCGLRLPPGGKRKERVRWKKREWEPGENAGGEKGRDKIKVSHTPTFEKHFAIETVLLAERSLRCVPHK